MSNQPTIIQLEELMLYYDTELVNAQARGSEFCITAHLRRKRDALLERIKKQEEQASGTVLKLVKGEKK